MLGESLVPRKLASHFIEATETAQAKIGSRHHLQGHCADKKPQPRAERKGWGFRRSSAVIGYLKHGPIRWNLRLATLSVVVPLCRAAHGHTVTIRGWFA
jgi:hypothetical protein